MFHNTVQQLCLLFGPKTICFLLFYKILTHQLHQLRENFPNFPEKNVKHCFN